MYASRLNCLSAARELGTAWVKTMNTLMIVRITKASLEDWKKTFQADTERRSAWMNTDEYQIGKVDENTALLVYSDFRHKTADGGTRKALQVRRVTVRR